MDSKMLFWSGIIVLIVMTSLKYLNLYFIKKVLPKKSDNEQKKYYENERILNEKSAFTSSRNDFYNFSIIIGIIVIIISFFEWLQLLKKIVDKRQEKLVKERECNEKKIN